jgi:hypothetical protein
MLIAMLRFGVSTAPPAASVATATAATVAPGRSRVLIAVGAQVAAVLRLPLPFQILHVARRWPRRTASG